MGGDLQDISIQPLRHSIGLPPERPTSYRLTASPSMPTANSGRFLFLDPCCWPQTSPTAYALPLPSRFKGRGRVVRTYGFWMLYVAAMVNVQLRRKKLDGVGEGVGERMGRVRESDHPTVPMNATPEKKLRTDWGPALIAYRAPRPVGSVHAISL